MIKNYINIMSKINHLCFFFPSFFTLLIYFIFKWTFVRFYSEVTPSYFQELFLILFVVVLRVIWDGNWDTSWPAASKFYCCTIATGLLLIFNNELISISYLLDSFGLSCFIIYMDFITSFVNSYFLTIDMWS